MNDTGNDAAGVAASSVSSGEKVGGGASGVEKVADGRGGAREAKEGKDST